MKICYIGNINPHVEKFTTVMSDRGHDVHLITFYYAEWKGITTYNLGGTAPYINKLLIPITTFRIKRLVKKIKPDIVHALYILPSGLYSALSGFHPLVISALGSDVLTNSKRFIFDYLTKSTLFRADLIHSVSEQISREIITLGINEKKIITVPIGVNTEKFNPNVDSTEIRTSLGWEDNPVVISMRYFEPTYNIECLINAISIVIKEIPYVKFIIKGTGSLENKLKSMVEELKISDSVKFIGRVDHEAISKYLNAADIYVSTSLSDGTSVSLLEAMSCGLPVVVTNIEANRPWIRNGENGYLFEKKYPKALATCIINLINDSEKLKIFGKKNREIVRERGDERKNMEKIEKSYIDLINNHEQQIRK